MRQTRSGHPTFPGWKFESPRLGIHVLTRERLLGRVEQCLGRASRGGDILLVSAPAGYGKSSLLAEWALRTSLPVVWYHLDHSDQDPATFLRGITHALKLRFTRPRWSVETMVDHLHADVLSDADLARASAVLAADIEQHVARPAALILTGVAELGTQSAGLSLLDQLLSRPKDHLRLALEWREAPQLRFSSLLAEQRLSAIGTEDLCLTDTELDALLTLAGASADQSYRDHVRRLCTGWVAGAVLAVGALTPPASPLPPDTLDNAAVADYLAHQVIEELPAALGSFAGEVAILSYMTPALCSRLLGLPIRVARHRLGLLERSTGFLTRSGQRPQELVYRFQPFLRQALLARGAAEPGGAAHRRGLQRRAARLLQEAGDHEEAVKHYAEAGDYEQIADLIEEVECDYLRASRGLLLARWLDLLPRTVYRRRLHLQLLRAELLRHRGKRSQALRLVEHLHEHLTTETGTAGTEQHRRWAAQALVISAEVQHDLAHYEESERASQGALEALDRLSVGGTAGDPALEALYARAHETMAATILLTRGPEAAEPHLRACERYCLDSGDLWRVGRHHYYRSKLFIREGNFAGAQSAAIAALLAAQEAQDEICAVGSRLNLGAIKMRLGRPVEAREELETAHLEARAAGYTVGQIYALLNLGDLALSSGAYPRAIQLYEQALEALETTEDIHAHLMTSAGLGYALALAGRPEEAIVRLSSLRKGSGGTSAGKSASSADGVVLALSLGFAYLRQGFRRHAQELFTQAEQGAERYGQTLKCAQAHLFLAAVHLDEGGAPEAESELLLALDGALAVHDSLALAVEVRRVPEVWPSLDRLDHPLATDLMGSVRLGMPGGFEAVEPGATGAPEAARATSQAEGDGGIRIYMFGPARVLVGTAPVTRWKKPAARDLLLYLVHQEGSASREAILTALWPDVDPEVSEGWFRQARFHLQHTLNRECLVQEESGHWRLDLDCWVDVAQADRLFDQGKRLIASGKNADGADCLRQALTLWHGPYLDDLYADWTARRRDELYQRRLGLLEQLASLELEAGASDKAAQLYQQILSTEPYLEGAHRGLMRCFVARGEPSRAIQHFREYASLLQEDLGTSPDKETLMLCRSILREMQTTSKEFRAFAGVVSPYSAQA